MFDVGHFVEIAEQVEKKKRNGIVAGASEDGVGVGGDGTDKREIDDGSDPLREAAADGSVVVDMDILRPESVVRKPAGFFFGKQFATRPVDGGIDFLELGDDIGDRELGESAHLASSRVSREGLRPSKILSGNPFLFVKVPHSKSSKDSRFTHRNVSASSRSMNVGGAALRSRSRA